MSSRFETTPERDSARYSSRTVMWLLGSMILIPVKVFIHGMEMLVRTMQGMEDATDRGLGVIAGEASTNGDGGESTTAAGSASGGQPAVFSGPANGTDTADTHNLSNHATSAKEIEKMTDTNLNDDMLKLVRYKILFIRRDYEHAFPEQEELVFDNMTDSAFTAWKIAEFIQSLDRTEVPTKWREKVPPYPPKQERRIVDGRETWVIHSLPETDKKHLRVYFEVLQRYAREKLKYEEDQLDALRGIKEAIERHGVTPGHSTASVAGGSAEPPKRGRAD